MTGRAAADLERRGPSPRPPRAGLGARGGRRRRGGAAGGDGAHRSRSWCAVLQEHGYPFCESAVARAAAGPDATASCRVDGGPRAAGAACGARGAVARARVALRGRRGSRSSTSTRRSRPSPRLAKIRTHEAVAAFLASLDAAPRVLCGDLNTPRREFADGDVLTFAHDSKGRLRPERGERWNLAERALVPATSGWTDAFRALHGFEPPRGVLEVRRRPRRLAARPRARPRASSRWPRPTRTSGAGRG